MNLRTVRQHIHQIGCDTVRRARTDLHRLHAHITAASPERYFALGFTYVTGPDGTVVRSRAHVSEGDGIEVHFVDGTVDATIIRKE